MSSSGRSGMISDLASLVNEAKSASSGGSGGGSNPYPPPPPSRRESNEPSPPSGLGSSVSGRGYIPSMSSNASVADDASLSSFGRSVARVARAAEGRDAASAPGGTRRGMIPPPPQSPRPGPGSVASGRGGSNNNRGMAGGGGNGNPNPYGGRAPSSQGSVASSGGRSSNGSRRSGRSGGSRSSNRSSPSNATDRLMSLVNELSAPARGAPRPGEDPSVGGGSGYLPNQYLRGQQASDESRRGGYSRGSSSRGGSSRISGGSSISNSGSSGVSGRSGVDPSPGGGSGTPLGGGSSATAASGVSGSMEPTGFVMPGGGGGGGYGPPGSSMGSGTVGSTAGGDTSASGGSSTYSNAMGSTMSGSSRTSAGQSTMPTDYGGFLANNSAAQQPQLMDVPYNDDPSADSFAGQPNHGESMGGSGVQMSSAASAPGGSFGSNPHINRNVGDASVASRSYLSQPVHGSNGSHGSRSNPDEFMSSQGSFVSGGSNGTPPGGSHFGGSVPGGSQYASVYSASQYSGSQNPYSHYSGSQQIVPGMYGDASTLGGSKSSRSLANSAAIIPQAKFSWASESVGTMSTVLTHRTLNSAQAVPEPTYERESSKAVEGRMWASFAWILTFAIPNKCIMRPTKDAKQAWREKVALFVIMVSCSVFFVGVFGFVPLLLCKEDTIFSMQDIWLQTGESWVVVHGVIYDVKDLIYRHPGGVKGIVDYLGKDGSKVFPRAPPVTLPEKCLDMEKVKGYNLDVYTPENNFTNPTCQSFSDLDVLLGITCHTFAAGSNGTAKFLGDYERGVISHTTVGLNAEGISWLALYDRVYDVTNYIKGINENQEPALDGEETTFDNNPAAYLTPTLNKVIMNSLGGDATDLYEALFGSSEYIACLEEMFYTGLLDDEFDTFCYTLNIMMYVMLVFVASLMLLQLIASMIYICPRHRTYSEEDVMSPVMIMVPCYNEGDNELRKTIKSVLNTTYPDENKVLFMVADGLVTGNGEDMSTPEHLANILGFDIDEFEDDTFEYDCIGVVHTKNRARVYHGILQKGHKFLKYITVVKCGLPEEATTSAKPGNRGKRDSQLVIMGYYNRIHYGRELTELDTAVQRAMVDLNLQADMVRFLMAIDADTRVDTMSITHMVYGMDKKEKVLALCGETKVDNKASSWVTMIQVFEYYNSHHLKKAFEAAFGCVTCLPGCFTMYRIIADDGTPLLPGDGVLYEYSRNDVETLHEKNLYHLGEDRMLTTLLLKYYPDRSLTFIPEAVCWTIVPHTFKILLSQRRRWINSTVHNMFELLRVNTMCGVCCISMKVVVFIDLVATMILPASYVYAMYLLFLVFFEDLPVSTVLLILYGIIMGVQVVVFILRSRWEYVWWFLVYFTIGLPIFYLVLPTYSFWNMDDFSWGKTRSVGGSAAANQEGGEDDEDDDDSKVVHKGGYGNLNEDDTSDVPSAYRDEDLRSTSSSSSCSASSGGRQGSRNGSDSESSDDDDDRSYDSRDSNSESEYSGSQDESEYFSHSGK